MTGQTHDCPRCNKKFKQKVQLKVHNEKHPNCKEKIEKERMFEEKRAKEKQELGTRHESVHAQKLKNTNRFKCKLCDNSFPIKAMLNSHMIFKHQPVISEVEFFDQNETNAIETNPNVAPNNNNYDCEKPEMILKVKDFAQNIDEENVLNQTDTR